MVTVAVGGPTTGRVADVRADDVVVVRALAGAVGVVLVLATLLSAIRTVVVPRGEQVLLTRAVFASTRVVVDLVARLRSSFLWTDRVMSLYAPVSLLLLPLVWMSVVFVGFGALFWAVGEGDVGTSLDLAGSSLLTLGFSRPETVAGRGIAFVGAGLAIAIVVLLLVTYLPTMYAAFSERERLVTMLETRAGAPPSAAQFLERMGRIRGLDGLTPVWIEWEDWFARVQESHTSQPGLVWFRSQRPEQSWITSAGAVLDAAALYVACIRHDERRPAAEVCLRAGFLSLREVADHFRLPFDPDPDPGDDISVTRADFDQVWDRLAWADIPLVDDRDAAWEAFAGWRVNYDEPLLRLARMVVAPSATWCNDEPRRRWLDDRDVSRSSRGSRGRAARTLR